MKLNVNIFNELNGSFEKEFKTKKQVIIESNKVTTEDLIKEAAPQPAQSGNIAPEPVVNKTINNTEVKDEVKPTEEDKEETKEMNEDYYEEKMIDEFNLDDNWRVVVYKDDDKNCVAIYDLDEPKDKFPKGQFVSAYNISTLLKDKDRIKDGLNLDNGVPKWKLNGEEVKNLLDKIETYNEVVKEDIVSSNDSAEEKEPVNGDILESAENEEYRKVEDHGNKYFQTYKIYIGDNLVGKLEQHEKDVKNPYYVAWIPNNYDMVYSPNATWKTKNFKDEEEAIKYITTNYKKEPVNEDQTVKIPNTEEEPDYIISDVTVIDQISDGDVQSPDIDGLLTLVSESLTNKYGDWGKINVLSTNKLSENSSYALVDITTKELLEEFKNRGIRDGAIGKNLIVESTNGLVEFKVNNLNGTTTFSKKSNNPASIIEEWVESEFLSEAKAEKEKEAEITKAKNEKDTVQYYIDNRLDLKMEIANIEMFIEMGKSIKDEGFTKMIQDRMYGFVAELPHSIEITNNDDKYELEFTNADNTVEMIFGKEWVKDPTEIPGNEVIGIINESYEQFNIGEIEVVFNPDTYETLYSIPSADVKDKKINLTKVPTVDTPYDTDTIIKSYVETKFGRIPTEEEVKEDKEEETNDISTEEVTDVNTEEPNVDIEDNGELQEDELPEEPDQMDNTNTEETDVEEAQNETGTARFVKIRPKQEVNLATVRERVSEEGIPESSYIVVDTKDLLPEEWEELTNDLTREQVYLNDVKSLDRKNYSFNVIKLTSAGAGYSLLVDPLGYGYPRYIAIKED